MNRLGTRLAFLLPFVDTLQFWLSFNGNTQPVNFVRIHHYFKYNEKSHVRRLHNHQSKAIRLPYRLQCLALMYETLSIYTAMPTISEDEARSNKTGNVRINVALRRVRVTIVAVEKQSVLHILSVCL
jgi:hypothetical protein